MPERWIHTAVELRICEEFDKVAAIKRLHMVTYVLSIFQAQNEVNVRHVHYLVSGGRYLEKSPDRDQCTMFGYRHFLRSA